MSPQLGDSGVRLAIRDEGEWVVAYLATDGTMEGAIEIARLFKLAAEEDGGNQGLLFQDWKTTLQEWMQRMLGRLLEIETTIIEKPAPPHERLQ